MQYFIYHYGSQEPKERQCNQSYKETKTSRSQKNKVGAMKYISDMLLLMIRYVIINVSHGSMVHGHRLVIMISTFDWIL